MRRFATPLIPLFLLAVATGMGCQDLYTTSMGAFLARDELSLPAALSVADATELAAAAKENDDPALASALVENLTTQVGATVTAANTKLAALAAGSAVVASGTSGAVMTALDSFLETGEAPTGTVLADIVEAIQAGSSASVLEAVVYLDPGRVGGGVDPAAVSDTLGTTDYMLAAVILAASALPAGVTDPSAMTEAEITTFQADPDVVAAARIVAAASALASAEEQDLLDQFAAMLNIPT